MPKQPRQMRPDIPADYGIDTGDKGMLEWAWVDEKLKESKNYWWVTTYPDGRPHVTPTWGAWVEGHLYSGGSDATRHAKNLSHNPNVIVHLESGTDVVIMYGTAHKTVNTTKVVQAEIEADYKKKYGMPEAPNFVFTPERVLCWSISDFAATPTKFLFE